MESITGGVMRQELFLNGMHNNSPIKTSLTISSLDYNPYCYELELSKVCYANITLYLDFKLPKLQGSESYTEINLVFFLSNERSHTNSVTPKNILTQKSIFAEKDSIKTITHVHSNGKQFITTSESPCSEHTNPNKFSYYKCIKEQLPHDHLASHIFIKELKPCSQ